jgi:hypothetical protein
MSFGTVLFGLGLLTLATSVISSGTSFAPVRSAAPRPLRTLIEWRAEQLRRVGASPVE